MKARFKNKTNKMFYISVLVSLLIHAGVALAIALPDGKETLLPEPKQKAISISLLSLSAPVAKQKIEPSELEEVIKEPVRRNVKLKESEFVKKEDIKKPVVKKQVKKTQPKKLVKKVKPDAKKSAKNNFDSKSKTPNKGKQKTTAYSVIKNPVIKFQTPPIYPKNAIRRGFQGVVIVEAVIDSTGLTQNTKVHKSSGHTSLDEAAIKAVKKWQFDLQNEKNIAKHSLVRVPVNFVINNS